MDKNLWIQNSTYYWVYFTENTLFTKNVQFNDPNTAPEVN